MRGSAEMIRLPFRQPFDWSSLVEFLSVRATPGVEVVDADSYRRTLSLGGAYGTLEVRRIVRRNFLELHINFPEPGAFPEIVGRVRHIFDLDTDPPRGVAPLEQGSTSSLVGRSISWPTGSRCLGRFRARGASHSRTASVGESGHDARRSARRRVRKEDA